MHLFDYQLFNVVRAPDCGSGGRGFETHLPPHRKPRSNAGFFYARKSVAVLVRSNFNLCFEYQEPLVSLVRLGHNLEILRLTLRLIL